MVRKDGDLVDAQVRSIDAVRPVHQNLLGPPLLDQPPDLADPGGLNIHVHRPRSARTAHFCFVRRT